MSFGCPSFQWNWLLQILLSFFRSRLKELLGRFSLDCPRTIDIGTNAWAAILGCDEARQSCHATLGSRIGRQFNPEAAFGGIYRAPRKKTGGSQRQLRLISFATSLTHRLSAFPVLPISSLPVRHKGRKAENGQWHWRAEAVPPAGETSNTPGSFSA